MAKEKFAVREIRNNKLGRKDLSPSGLAVCRLIEDALQSDFDNFPSPTRKEWFLYREYRETPAPCKLWQHKATAKNTYKAVCSISLRRKVSCVGGLPFECCIVCTVPRRDFWRANPSSVRFHLVTPVFTWEFEVDGLRSQKIFVSPGQTARACQEWLTKINEKLYGGVDRLSGLEDE